MGETGLLDLQKNSNRRYNNKLLRKVTDAEFYELYSRGYNDREIAKLTGSKKMELKEEWVNRLVNQAQSNGIPIFLKDNLNWKGKLQEFPKEKNKP